MAENGLRRLAATGFEVTCLRFATAYGDSPRLRTDLALNNLLAHAVTTGEVKLRSTGRSRRPLIHCRDMARALLAFAEAPQATPFQAVNVGSEAQNHRIIELAEMVGEQVSGAAVAMADGAADDPRDYRVDFGLLRARLPGFACRHMVRPAIRTLHQAYLGHPTFREDFQTDRYTRLAVLRRCLESATLPAYFREGAIANGKPSDEVRSA